MSQEVETAVSVSIRIPTVLRKFTDNQPEVQAEGGSILSAITDLTARHPSLRSHLFDAAGSLRSFVNVYLNDEDVRYLDGHDTALKEGDQLAIIPAVAGG